MCTCNYTTSNHSYSFSVMQQCWASDPDDRPTFASLSTDLAQNLSTMADYLTLSRDIETLAVNISESSRESSRYVLDPTETHDHGMNTGYVDLCQATLSPSEVGYPTNDDIVALN